MSDAVGEIHAVTGALSYTGRYIARELLQARVTVRGLVRNPESSGAPEIECRPLQFHDADRLSADLEGVSILYNTYWIRFPRAGATFEGAVRNTAVLASAAKRAGVRRIVHLSVSNPSQSSPFGYFRGKAAAEDVIVAAGLPCSIVRPTLVFGDEDILLNNIAWLLRRFHAFVLPGDGAYRVQPVFVGDVAHIAVAEARADGNRVLDAAGSEILPFGDIVYLLRSAVETWALIAKAPLPISVALGQLISPLLRDVVITHEELEALIAETLISSSPPSASTSFSDWVRSHGRSLGRRYTSELSRHWMGTTSR